MRALKKEKIRTRLTDPAGCLQCDDQGKTLCHDRTTNPRYCACFRVLIKQVGLIVAHSNWQFVQGDMVCY